MAPGTGRPDLVVAYGRDPGELVPGLLDALGVAASLPSSGTIGIKPNLVLDKPASSGATTDPAVVGAIVLYLHDHGCRDLVILEGSWVGASTRRAFARCGYEELARRHGVPLVDLQEAPVVERVFEGRRYGLCRPAVELAYLVNVPVLKAHCQTLLTCALKNLKGCLPNAEKRRFHEIGLHGPIADLNALLRTDLVVVDALNGDLTFEEGGTPVRMDRLFAGRDPVLVDAYAASLLGYEPADVPYVGLAEARGVGSSDLGRASVLELNRPSADPAPYPRDGLRELLSLVRAEAACSPCMAALVHALQRLGPGERSRLPAPVSVGQGFRGRSGLGLGVGACTSGLERSLGGCPPSAREVARFLRGVRR